MYKVKDCVKLELIDNGEFGEVYHAQDPNHNDVMLAFKFLYVHFADYHDIIEKAKIERTLKHCQRLNHPAILNVYDYNLEGAGKDKRIAILTEYCSNGSLEEAMPHLNDTQKMINIYGIANAMMILHRFDILHYDLAPYNILEDEQYQPKIKDIGFSKCFKSLSSMCKIHHISRYNAPEIATEDVYNKPCEVFSFGCIVYEILTGEKAFKKEGVSDNNMLIQKINGYRPGLPEKVPLFYRMLIDACWEENPEARPTFEQICSLMEITFKNSLNKQ